MRKGENGGKYKLEVTETGLNPDFSYRSLHNWTIDGWAIYKYMIIRYMQDRTDGGIFKSRLKYYLADFYSGPTFSLITNSSK